jgi:hypothetical protein
VFVVELAGLQAVVKLAEEFVEQVSLGLAVPVSGGAAGIEVAAGTRGAVQRCQHPDRADRGQAPVLICRCFTTVFFPLARVIGADLAKAFNPRASAKRARSSPISASTRAPARFPRPGKRSHGSKSQAATASGGAECVNLVVELVGAQALIQLAEELVEQVPLRLGVAVPVVSAAAVMRVGGRGRAQRAEGPQEPCLCEIAGS